MKRILALKVTPMPKPRYFVAPLTPIDNSWWYVRDREFPDEPNMAIWQMWADLKGSHDAAVEMCRRLNKECQ